MVLGLFDAVAGVAFDGLLVLFGVGVLWLGGRQFRQGVAIARTPVRDVAAVDPDADRVEIAGTVAAADGTVESPVEGAECVLATWSVEDYVGHEWGQGGGWTEQAEDYRAAPFLVEDGTGTARVELSGDLDLGSLEVDLSEDDEPAFEVGPTDDAPPHLQSLVADRDGVPDERDVLLARHEDDYPHGFRRFSEARLAPGDEVYVTGAPAAPDGEWGGPDVVVAPPDEGFFVLSDATEAGVVRQRLFRAAVSLVVGGLAAGYGGYQLLVTRGLAAL